MLSVGLAGINLEAFNS